MIAILKTAERARSHGFPDNYVYQRHVFAYRSVPMKDITGKMVLEIGCGEGYGMEMLCSEAAYWLAVDKKKPAHIHFSGKLDFRKCILPDLSILEDESFDTIICFQVIEHIGNDHALMQEMKRVLKTGGKLYLTTPNRDMSLTRNPFHVREYTPPQMMALAARHFHRPAIKGIFGNRLVMDYYETNKRTVEKFLRFDPLNLQYAMPAFMLRGLYSLLNNYNRLLIARQAPDLTSSIHYTDFFLDSSIGHCLDYFLELKKI
jgi:2-polyprenyl-3-methyl-5-hydroxy-6-metoxy-1,4-benzoquinol methylase